MEVKTMDDHYRELTRLLVDLHGLCGYSADGCAFHPDNSSEAYESFTEEQVAEYIEKNDRAWTICNARRMDIAGVALVAYYTLVYAVTRESAERVLYPDVEVTLTGTDGNVFAIMGAVLGALRRAGKSGDVQDAFLAGVRACKDYDEALRLVMRTVTVS